MSRPEPASGAGLRAVLFDLDGVLVDSFEAWFHTVNATARAFGAPPISQERYGEIWGQGVSSDVEHLYPGRSHQEVEDAFEEHMLAQRASIRVNPEAAAVLDDLGRRGLARACVTNTQIGLARTVLEAASLLGRFENVQGMAEGRREKPAPDLLLAALEAVGATPAQALMVGDSRYDREAALAARVAFLHVDLRTGDSLRAALAPVLAGA